MKKNPFDFVFQTGNCPAMTNLFDQVQLYSLYLNEKSIELRLNEDSDFGEGQFICSQKNYQSILEFGRDLAVYKNLSFINYVALASEIDCNR